MTKHRYKVNGLICCKHTGKKFYGECISDDIIKAINMFREHELWLSVHSIERLEQVHADSEIGITKICF